jgi:RimJ/RimL family protein N-acetyltransferase
VHLKQTDAFIGWCGLKYLPESDEIDLGYRFFQQYWGNGYATEAARYTLDHAFNILHLSTITGRAHIENHASQNVLEKIGMRFIKEEMEGDCPLKIYSISRFPTK